MGAARFTLSFVDGTTREVARRPVHWMRAERILSPDAKANETLLCSLWAADTGGTGDYAAFEAWAETLEDWEPAKSEEAESAPLDQAPST